jgi:glucose/arabinose dehydrogenase
LKQGDALSTPFLDISSAVADDGERGLLGFAFAPDYASSGLVYVHYSNNSGDTRIVEYKVSSDPDRLDAGSARTILAVGQPQSNHNGGTMAFDRDGMLIIALGDGGGGGDPGNRAQNLNTLLGKLLRIDPRNPGGGKPYGIPSNNPFVGKNGLDELWAYGLRNPWRFAFDEPTGDLYVADVGQNRFEEINRVVPPLQSGANYGWRAYEGTSRFTRERIDESRLMMPVHVYSLAGARCAVIGGHVYRGSVNSLNGRYLYADWCDGLVRSFRMINGRASDFRTHTQLQTPNLAAFGEDGMGEVYYGSTSGQLFKIVKD